MSDIIEPISLSDALALVGAIPDTVVPVGPVEAVRRAESVVIDRTEAGWRIAFPRSGTVQIGADTLTERLQPITFPVAALATASIEMTHPDGRVFRIPAILAQALLGWLYVRLESGDLVPALPPAPSPNTPAPAPTEP